MIRKQTLVSLLAVGVLATACQTAADKQKQADQAQIEADQKKTDAKRLADQKAGEQRRGMVMEPRRVDASGPTAEQTDYKAKVNTQLGELELQLAEMERTAGNAPANVKADYDRAINDVIARRDALQTDEASLETVTPQSWGPLKTRIDKDLTELKRSVRTASSHIKTVPRGAAPNAKPPATTRAK